MATYLPEELRARIEEADGGFCRYCTEGREGVTLRVSGQNETLARDCGARARLRPAEGFRDQ
jgi:hypothetical protein